jgi:hypothetical protein
MQSAIIYQLVGGSAIEILKGFLDDFTWFYDNGDGLSAYALLPSDYSVTVSMTGMTTDALGRVTGGTVDSLGLFHWSGTAWDLQFSILPYYGSSSLGAAFADLVSIFSAAKTGDYVPYYAPATHWRPPSRPLMPRASNP